VDDIEQGKDRAATHATTDHIDPGTLITISREPRSPSSESPAFGTEHYEDTQQLTKGLSSASVFKITIHGKLS
jgi:hypothetical protein